MAIYVLKLGHRIHRDYRLDTHLALAARAFLADKLYYTGTPDKEFENRINKVSTRFGGFFNLEYLDNFKTLTKSFKGKIIHLTMYGKELNEEINEIAKSENVLIIVGGEKVQPEIYEIADYNIAIKNQPHSEVSALAIFLEKYCSIRNIKDKFKNAAFQIIGSEKGKKVVKS
ncbi:tRNA (cytidine(56)-2'-O)-methyltransferase [Candidatus Woesearchaeota archaeon]|nr:tRNA (cytidine(56)-2'-O)-methyltransferase [Candidatus Woesearchaeota archaeon]